MSSNSKDERSPSPDGSASPDIRHQKPRLKSRSPPKRSQSGSPSLDGSASPDISHQKPRSKSRSPPKRSQSGSPSPDGSASPDIRHQKPRSKSRSPPPKRSQLGSPEDVSNPGNNLYVTGLSTRVNSNDLQTFFSKEGKVLECCLVTDPRTKESRGFAFITMETREQAERCIKHLNRSVLEGRLVTVEKAKRARGRTPTPGRYEGLRKERGGPVGRGQGRGQGRGRGQGQGRRRSPSYSPRRRFDREHHYRDPHPRDRGARSRSPYGRRADDYSYQRHRERSSGGRSGYH